MADLDKSFEDMEIKDDDEDVFNERSRLVDEKIRQKERLNEENEFLLKKKKEEALKKKKKAEERKNELAKNISKKRKQKLKDKSVNKFFT